MRPKWHVAELALDHNKQHAEEFGDEMAMTAYICEMQVAKKPHLLVSGTVSGREWHNSEVAWEANRKAESRAPSSHQHVLPPLLSVNSNATIAPIPASSQRIKQRLPTFPSGISISAIELVDTLLS